MQMTKRPNDQKDLGEPAFSPDGKYLYYSQDVTPGATFEYNKDPNAQLHAIVRLDLVLPEGMESQLRDNDLRDALKEAYFLTVSRDIQRAARVRMVTAPHLPVLAGPRFVPAMR